jgi:hypothetical protein
MKRVGSDKIRNLLPKLDSDTFSAEVFSAAGIFIVRNAIAPGTIRFWQSEWNAFYASALAKGRNVNRFNPVQVNEALPASLAGMPGDSALLDIVEQTFGPDIALYNHRFVIKDKASRGAVFPHHDFCYQFGWPTKASAFVPLTTATPENGALVFYPGTHQFGYLGDAGEINPEIVDPDWPTISPSLEPGDIALMDSSTWHYSVPYVSGPDRILADIIYQPANDPSGAALLRGEWRTEIFLNRIPRTDLFKRSRSTMLRQMESRILGLEAGKDKPGNGS